jgi:glutathione S-transferase
LKQAGIPFKEEVVPLRAPDTPAVVRKHSPSGKLPVLKDGSLAVWDSLSICEYLAEKFPDRHLWPADAAARALARSICAEMHAGFPNLRNQFWFNAVGEMTHAEPTTDTAREIARIEQLWGDARARYGKGGAFLFGAFTNADAFYAPVVSRFKTYGVTLGREAREYCDTMLALPAMKEWVAGARAEMEA